MGIAKKVWTAHQFGQRIPKAVRDFFGGPVGRESAPDTSPAIDRGSAAAELADDLSRAIVCREIAGPLAMPVTVATLGPVSVRPIPQPATAGERRQLTLFD